MQPLRHLVFLRFHSSASQDDVIKATTALSALSSQIPDVLFYDVYPLSDRVDLKASKGCTLMLDSVFKDLKATQAYISHPAHKAVLDLLQPLLADHVVYDYFPHPREGFTVHEFDRLQHPPYARRVVLYSAKAGQDAAIEKRFYVMHDLHAIPALLRTVVGRQAGVEEMGEGWIDRSGGLQGIVEWVMTDGQGVQQFLAHPEYRRVMAECAADMVDTLTFDYDMH